MTGGSGVSWEERFERFAVLKTRDAVEAQVAPFATEIDRASQFGAPAFVAVGNRWTSGLFDGPFYISPVDDTLPTTNLVFVQSADLNTVADDPGALGGGNTDKHVVYEGLSRVAADAVLAGAETIRGGDVVFSVWHPELVAMRDELGLPRHPVQIVATRRGVDFAHTLLLNVPSVPVVILTVDAVARQIEPAVAERPWIRLVTLRPPTELTTAFAGLRASGMRRISAVGGRTLATALLDAGIVDDLS